MKITLLVEGARHTVDLTEEGITLGRGDAASIKVTSNAVSRQHARIFLKDGRPHVVDLKSLNGTTLNGEPVPVPSAMRPGDVVLMGEIPVQWLAEAAPESISGGFQANPLGAAGQPKGATQSRISLEDRAFDQSGSILVPHASLDAMIARAKSERPP